MTTGITTFSTAGRKVATVKPITEGEYELTVPAGGWSVEVSDKKPDAVPYLRGYFEVALADGKTRRVYHAFHNGVTPSPKDGVAMTDRKNSITAFAIAADSVLAIGDDGVLTKQYQDDEGNEKTTQYLDPRQVKAYLEGLAGTKLRGKVVIEKGTGNYEDKNVISKFLPPKA